MCYYFIIVGDGMRKEREIFYKKEFIDRYMYLYMNSEFILAPFLYEETKEEMHKRSQKYQELNLAFDGSKPLIYLKVDDKTLSLLEEFLLSDKEMIDSDLYKKIEYLKKSNKYYADVEYGLSLLEKKNQGCLSFLKTELDLWKLLSEVRGYILNQSGDQKNKNLKLEVLDEYFRVNRYSNDGKVWTSGFDLTFHDISHFDNFSMVGSDREVIPHRKESDIGVLNNNFINFFANTSIFKKRRNSFHFSEKEKQEIYLSLCDELPWDLKGFCIGEKKDPSTSLEMGYPVLNNVSSCGSEFIIKEEDIFIDENSTKEVETEDFYQLCPECGYLVRVTDYIENVNVKKRIISRCKGSVKQLKK